MATLSESLNTNTKFVRYDNASRQPHSVKKVLVAVSILIVLVACGAYFWQWNKASKVTSNPIDAIPTSAVIIVSYPELTKTWDVFEDQDYYDVLTGVEELSPFFRRNQLLDSLIRYDQQLKKALSNSVVWSSYHSSGKDSLLAFHVIQTEDINDQQALTAISKALSGAGVISEQLIGETRVQKLVTKDPYDVLYLTTKNSLILVSSNLELLEQSLSQLRTGKSLKTDPQFAEAVSASGKNVEANVLINYANLPNYLSGVLKPSLVTSVGLSVKNLAGWTELDVNLKSEGMTFNGFSHTSDSLNQFLNVFLTQQPQPIGFPEFLPSNTASFLFFGIDDVLALSTSYRDFLNANERLAILDQKLDSINAHYDVNIEQNFLAWLGNSFGRCVLKPSSESFTDNTYFIVQTSSNELSKKLLNDLTDKLISKNNSELDSADVNGTIVQKLPLNGILSALFGDGFSAFENPYYVVHKNYVVFGTNKQSVTSYLQYIQGDRTLAKELSFSRFAENLGSSYNIFSYHHLAYAQPILESYLNRDAAVTVKKNEKIADSFEAIGTQISTTGKSFYSNVFLKYNPNWKTTEETSWEAKMDANPTGTPVYVKNHLNGENEILTQDEDNALYLFNEFGQRLFKANLPEKIMGSPQQVDALKNGKLQYIFNTKNFIYLIDRKGRNVTGFPIELNSPAITDLAIFDYDNDKDYRLLITCANKHIYNYNIKGKKISGWKHNQASDLTIHPFKHLAVSGKDYLITGESNGKIHLLDRRGKNRVKVKRRVTPSTNNHLQTFKSSEEAFTGVYITDKDGTIYRISLNGDVNPMELGKFSPEHQFFVADLDKDGGPEFIFTDLNVLQVFDYKKQKIAEQRLEPSATKPFLIDLGEGGIGIGYCYKDSEQLVLYNSTGSLVEGFPLSGSSTFSLLKTEKGVNVVSSNSKAGLSIQSIR